MIYILYISLILFIHRFIERHLFNNLQIEYQKDTVFELTIVVNNFYKNNPFLFRIISTVYCLLYDLIVIYNLILNNNLISLLFVNYIIRYFCLYLVLLPVDKNIRILNGYLPSLGTFYINDFFYSGHTSSLMLSILVNWNIDYIIYINLLLLMITIFIMITTRMHYTQDIITGLSVGINIYYLLH